MWDLQMGCLPLKTVAAMFPGRNQELLKAIAVFNEIPHNRVGNTLVFPGDARVRFERAIADYDRRRRELRAATPVAVGA